MKFRRCVCACLLAIALPAVASDITYQKKFGDWRAVISTHPMTDEQICTVMYEKPVKARNVYYTSKDAFKLDFKGHGGITTFQYRFGKAIPSEMETVPDVDNNVITVPVFVAEVLDMPNLRLTGGTVLRTGISLDISLKGLKEARNSLAKRCSWSDLPPLNGGAPDWAVWQVTPKN